MKNKTDYFSILNLSVTASTEEIYSTYCRVAQILQPEIHLNEVKAEQFDLLQLAFELLSDEKTREAYEQGSFILEMDKSSNPGWLKFLEIVLKIMQTKLREDTTCFILHNRYFFMNRLCYVHRGFSNTVTDSRDEKKQSQWSLALNTLTHAFKSRLTEKTAGGFEALTKSTWTLVKNTFLDVLDNNQTLYFVEGLDQPVVKDNKILLPFSHNGLDCTLSVPYSVEKKQGKQKRRFALLLQREMIQTFGAYFSLW